MKTETAQIRTEVDPVEPQLTLVPKSGYAEMWELAAEGIYLYKGNGTYYYRLSWQTENARIGA